MYITVWIKIINSDLMYVYVYLYRVVFYSGGCLFSCVCFMNGWMHDRLTVWVQHALVQLLMYWMCFIFKFTIYLIIFYILIKISPSNTDWFWIHMFFVDVSCYPLSFYLIFLWNFLHWTMSIKIWYNYV